MREHLPHKPKPPAATKIEKPSVPLWAKVVLPVLFVAYCSVFLARQINFATADLGRHLTNGKIFAESGKIISTNFYSYTEPDFPAINHHWGSGVIFYMINEYSGFRGLSVFYVLTVLASALFFMAAALRFADARLVFFSAVIAVPLVAWRTEVRPEGISMFFTGLFFYLLVLFRENKLSRTATLMLLGIAQVLWVNCHIFFFMGFMLAGMFIAEEFLCRNDQIKINQYLFLLSVLVAASFINPFFIKGFLAPFTILNEYGYQIADNKSVVFMQKRFGNTEFMHIEVQAAIFLLLFAFLIIRKKFKQSLLFFLPLAVFGLLAFMMVRSIPLFALAAIPAAAFLLQCFAGQANASVRRFGFNALAAVGAIIILSGFMAPSTYFSPIKSTTGIGLFPGMNSSAQFFLGNNIKGPIFNNYDIGGYLIYYLYGKEKVFVDNRPEAYSVSFFKETYIRMQEKMEKFREVEGQYHFNCIWFYRHDATARAQHFLLQLLEQPDYAPVFVDDVAIMFLKRNEQNAPLITRYELDKAMFRSVPYVPPADYQNPFLQKK